MKVPPSSKTQRSGKDSKVSKNDGPSSDQKERSKKSVENQQVCAACLFQISSASQDYCSTQCSHHYHERCLEQWLKQKNTCCLCRQKIKKYISKSKGEIAVPERFERRGFFDLLIPLDSLENPIDFPQIVVYQADNNPWLLLTNHHNRRHHRLSVRNHFIFSIGGSSSQNMLQEDRSQRVIEPRSSQEHVNTRSTNQQPEERVENNDEAQVENEAISRPQRRKKIVRKSNKTSKKSKPVTRSSTKKSSRKNKAKEEIKPVVKISRASRNSSRK